MSYEIIPQAPRYEMNASGVIRNRATGKILKWTKGNHGTKTAQLYLGNRKRICVTLPHLLWQLHGNCTSPVAPIAVSIKKGTRTLSLMELGIISFANILKLPIGKSATSTRKKTP